MTNNSAFICSQNSDSLDYNHLKKMIQRFSSFMKIYGYEKKASLSEGTNPGEIRYILHHATHRFCVVACFVVERADQVRWFVTEDADGKY
jgi:hypothetical protein